MEICEQTQSEDRAASDFHAPQLSECRAKPGSVVALDKGTGSIAIFRKLRAAGARIVVVHLCGLEITRRRIRGARLLSQLTKHVAVRCLVDDAGTASVFPRPYCHATAQGLFVNGQLFDPQHGPLATFRVVWPELDRELQRRLGSFVCDGTLDARGPR